MPLSNPLSIPLSNHPTKPSKITSKRFYACKGCVGCVGCVGRFHWTTHTHPGCKKRSTRQAPSIKGKEGKGEGGGEEGEGERGGRGGRRGRGEGRGEGVIGRTLDQNVVCGFTINSMHV